MKCWLPPITAYQTVPKSGDIVPLLEKRLQGMFSDPLLNKNKLLEV